MFKDTPGFANLLAEAKNQIGGSTLFGEPLDLTDADQLLVALHLSMKNEAQVQEGLAGVLRIQALAAKIKDM